MLDKASKDKTETDKTILRNRATIDQNDKVLKIFDDDTVKTEKQIESLTSCKLKLQEELKINEDAAQVILRQIDECGLKKKEGEEKMESRKKDFNEMKRQIDTITLSENEIK